MKHARTPITAVVIMSMVIGSAPAQAVAPEKAPASVVDIPRGTDILTRDQQLLADQMRAHPNLPPISFWVEAVAQCETAQEWDRGHDWGPRARSYVSGGLGIANSTWRGFGGRRFAKKAAFASKWAQIYVANKIGFLGHQTNIYRTWDDRVAGRRHYRQPAGFDQGWGGTCRLAWIKKHRWKWRGTKLVTATHTRPTVP